MTDIKTTGALFITDKQGNPSRPDYNGDIKLTQEFLAALVDALGDQPDCKIKLAGWKKVGQKGTYLSLSVQPPFRKSDARPPPTGAPEGPRGGRIHNDEIPFAACK